MKKTGASLLIFLAALGSLLAADASLPGWAIGPFSRPAERPADHPAKPGLGV